MIPATIPAAVQPASAPAPTPERSWEHIEAAMEALARRPLADKIALIGPWRAKSTGSMEGREGLAWSCDICKNGKVVGYARNDGNGGMTDVRFLGADRSVRDALMTEFLAAAKAYDPETTFEVDGGFASHLLDLADEVKSLKRWCKTKVCFRTATMKMGEWGTFSVPFSADVAVKIRAKRPDITEFANEVIGSY